MPITSKNEGQDPLGDLLNGNGPQADDPGRFQRAENEQRRRELNGPEYAELKFPAFPESETDLKGWSDAAAELMKVQPDLLPHQEFLLAKHTELSAENPDLSNNECVKQAVLRTRTAVGLPLHGEKLPPKTRLIQNEIETRNSKELSGHIAWLHSEQAGTKKMRDNPEVMYRGPAAQYRPYAPKEKRGR